MIRFIAFGSGFILSATPAIARPPNIVVVISDDQSTQHFGFMGGNVLTPTMDRLAEDGVVFLGHHCISTVCSPSRFNFLTGRRAGRKARTAKSSHPYFMFGTNVSADDESIITALRRAGYFTGVIGKADGYDWWAPTRADEEKLGDRLDPKEPAHQSILKARELALHKRIQKATHADYVGGIFPGNPAAWPFSLRYHNQDWLTATAFAFIEQAKANRQPFFLWMPATIVHTGDRITRENFAAEEIRRTTPFGLLDQPLRVQPSRSSILERIDEAAADPQSFPITWLDDSLAAVIGRLEDEGLLDDTIIVYTSDHSGFGGKGTLYEKGTKLPLIIYWKGVTEQIPPNDQLVGSVDLVPTLLDLAGVADDGYPTDGRSLASAILTGDRFADQPLLLELGHQRAVISADGKYKYIAFRMPWDALQVLPGDHRQRFIHTNDLSVPDRPDGGQEFDEMIEDSIASHPAYFAADQLYDLEADPEETWNLAPRSERGELLAEMKALLANELRSMPGSFGNFTFEARVDPDGKVHHSVGLEGDLDLTEGITSIALADGSLPRDDFYTVIRYTGALKGRFAEWSRVERFGYAVDYDQPGEIRLRKISSISP